ncbi:hypothetical protein GGR57DRAFT_518969 [Xylariaceae sp. FL1272]|nr:hypothetical protein GGR57DRAFT_518969 [Xylariaceae sp. FL1272]
MKHHMSIVSGRLLGSQWNSLIPSCILFLHNYLHVFQLPAFYPYRWVFPGKVQPLHECFVMLEYLKEPSSQDYDVQLLHYLLNEIFDIFKPREASDEVDTLEAWQRAAYELYAAPWAILRQTHDEIEEENLETAQSRIAFAAPHDSNNNFQAPPRQNTEVQAVTAATRVAKWTNLPRRDNRLGHTTIRDPAATEYPRTSNKEPDERMYTGEPDAISGLTASGWPVTSNAQVQMVHPVGVASSPGRQPLSRSGDGMDDDDSHEDDSQGNGGEMDDLWSDFIVLDEVFQH